MNFNEVARGISTEWKYRTLNSCLERKQYQRVMAAAAIAHKQIYLLGAREHRFGS